MGLEERLDTTIRCPLLGGTVPLRYCLKLEAGKPCRQTRRCWAARIPEVLDLIEDQPQSG